MRQRDKPVVLFVAEAVTLAHFARITALARALEAASYETVLASDPRYLGLEKPLACAFHPIQSIPSPDFARALTRGKPLYDVETLTRYVEDDLKILDTVKPDLVVGDFRLSLAVSAPLLRVPYAAVVNAYWSPYADISYPVPDLAVTKFLGVGMAQRLFNIAKPLAFAMHAQPLNRVRRLYGLLPLGHDLRKTYTWGDFTLYADIPEMVPTHQLPENHHYLGPIFWSTDTPLPEWWHSLPDERRPIVLLTLGSSGKADLLPLVLQVLSQFPVTIMVATAGKTGLGDLPDNVFVTDYLPMNIASQRAQLVIGNGGSLTTYQALANGVPVIGICSNMDQLLNMGAVERLGAGIGLRAEGLGPAEILAAVKAGLENPSFTQASRRIGQTLLQYDAVRRFRTIVSGIIR